MLFPVENGLSPAQTNRELAVVFQERANPPLDLDVPGRIPVSRRIYVIQPRRDQEG